MADNEYFKAINESTISHYDEDGGFLGDEILDLLLLL